MPRRARFSPRNATCSRPSRGDCSSRKSWKGISSARSLACRRPRRPTIHRNTYRSRPSTASSDRRCRTALLCCMALGTAASDPTGLVDCAAYCSGARVEDVGLEQIGHVLERNDRFVWMGLVEPEKDLLRQVQRQFRLHDLAIEDAYNAHQRPKLEQYEDSLFVVLRTARIAGDKLELGETHVFVGDNYVVTVRHGSLLSHVGLRARCESTPQLLAKGPGYVLYALMDFVVDQYLPVVQRYEEQVQEVEEDILDGVVSTESTARIYRLKRDLLMLRRTVAPLVEVCNRLMRFDFPQIPADTRL